jgi:DNA-binding transcriptional MerR regulator
MRLLPIGSVGELTRVPAHTIRYWEKAFPEFLKPVRTEGGQRRYSLGDVQAIKTLNSLLHEQGLTTKGARQALGLP